MKVDLKIHHLQKHDNEIIPVVYSLQEAEEARKLIGLDLRGI